MDRDLERLVSRAAAGIPAAARPGAPATIRFNFDAGWPAAETFPVDLLADLARQVITEPDALGYVSVDHDPEHGGPIYGGPGSNNGREMMMGSMALREELARWVGRRQGIDGLDADHFIITSGATQAIALAISAFVNPGEGALVEALTFMYTLRSLQLRGAEIRMVDIDEDGIVIEALENQLRAMADARIRPKLLYLIPTFHLPTGAVLPLERRRRVLELADEWDLVVIEDAIYSDLRFEGETVPSLLSLDTSGRVMQAHAFSKILATGLRVGWMCGDPTLIDALGAVREDLGVSQWLSRILSEFMAGEQLEPQIARAADEYRRRRDLAVNLLREHCGDLISFSVPEGGWYLWIRVDDSVDWNTAREHFEHAGVQIRDANRFMAVGESHGPAYFRLSYSHPSDEEMAEGIAHIGAALRAATG